MFETRRTDKIDSAKTLPNHKNKFINKLPNPSWGW